MIDPAKLEQQRNVIALERPEYKCPGCGTRTRDKSGRCRSCRINDGLPDPRTLQFDRLVSYLNALKAEMHRRRDEIARALEVEP